jgi:hypothetical protein
VRFEELCKQLLLIIYPHLKTIDGRGGDRGTDSFLGNIDNQLCVFQFKYFTPKIEGTHWYLNIEFDFNRNYAIPIVAIFHHCF